MLSIGTFYSMITYHLFLYLHIFTSNRESIYYCQVGGWGTIYPRSNLQFKRSHALLLCSSCNSFGKANDKYLFSSIFIKLIDVFCFLANVWNNRTLFFHRKCSDQSICIFVLLKCPTPVFCVTLVFKAINLYFLYIKAPKANVFFIFYFNVYSCKIFLDSRVCFNLPTQNETYLVNI